MAIDTSLADVEGQAAERALTGGALLALDQMVAPDSEASDFLMTSALPLSSMALGLFDQSDDWVTLIDLDGRTQIVNRNGRRALEIDSNAGVRGRSWEALWPEEAHSLVQDAVAQARGGKLSRFEGFCPTANGTPKWWEVRVSPILHMDGSVGAILASSRDVTEHKLKDDEWAAEAAKMRHRLRNAFAVGAALSLAMGKDQPEHRSFATELGNKLTGLAGVQAALADAADVPLAEIIGKILKVFEPKAGSVSVDEMLPVRLDEQRAKALVLVLGELATNSLKYGAMSGRGDVTISSWLEGEELVLRWREVHSAAEEPASYLNVPGGGLGEKLMSRMLAAVGGSMDSKHSEDGYLATITIPL